MLVSIKQSLVYTRVYKKITSAAMSTRTTLPGVWQHCKLQMTVCDTNCKVIRVTKKFSISPYLVFVGGKAKRRPPVTAAPMEMDVLPFVVALVPHPALFRLVRVRLSVPLTKINHTSD